MNAITQIYAHYSTTLTSNLSKRNMSFAMSLDKGKREWSGVSFASVFAQKRNIASPSFLWMLREIVRFNKQCLQDRDSGYLDGMTIGDYLQSRRFSDRFRDDYLIPMAAAIWSTPKVKMMDFPAASFIQFFENHRLLELIPPYWRTVSGGSRNYHQSCSIRLKTKLNPQRLSLKSCANPMVAFW